MRARLCTVPIFVLLLTFLTSSAGVAGAPPFPATIAPLDAPPVFLPVVQTATSGLAVNPQDRQASQLFYQQVYLASENVPIDWTGNHSTCNAGTTSQSFRDAVLLRINYFRAMAGVPAGVAFSTEYTRKAQQAALMMSRNGQLSHSPPSNWACYTAEGAEAAGSSNLYLGTYSWGAIDGYIEDPGSGNSAAGHRRWILYPQTQAMGTGDIPSTGGYWAANALWVFDANMWGARPPTREEFVAWPPPGYVPYQVVFPRWSFSYDEAGFSSATVSMTRNGSGISVSVKPVVNGYGENTLVWEPNAAFGIAPMSDITYTVSIQNVLVGSVSRSFAYNVIVFNPGSGGGGASARPRQGELGTPPELP
jgi:uncharacterized protein YkwD